MKKREGYKKVKQAWVLIELIFEIILKEIMFTHFKKPSDTELAEIENILTNEQPI